MTETAQPPLWGPPDEVFDPRPYIEAQPWRFAKTVVGYPHEYLTYKASTDAAAHSRFIDLIRRTGEYRLWRVGGYQRKYRYLDIDGLVYWEGPPTIINRKHPDAP